MTYCKNCDVGMSSGFRYNLCPPCLRIVAKEQDEHECCYRRELDELKAEMEQQKLNEDKYQDKYIRLAETIDILLEGYRNDYKK